ncbi:cytochrome D1 domain-containing protein [Pseudomonas aeruginosa]|nr:cytochrome D1 domain-containing protein [Pseudomonas aeruginosa]
MNLRPLAPLFLALLAGCSQQPPLRGSGDLGVLIERAGTTASVQILDGTAKTSLARVEGLGDLSHLLVFSATSATPTYSVATADDQARPAGPAHRQAPDPGRQHITRRSARTVGWSRYPTTSRAVKVFDGRTLELVAEIPATRLPARTGTPGWSAWSTRPGSASCSACSTAEIWIADFSQGDTPHRTRFRDIGKQPYDALIGPDGRYYMAGLFGEDGMASSTSGTGARRRARTRRLRPRPTLGCRCAEDRTWRAGPSPATRPSSRRSAITRCWCSTRATGSRPTPSTSPASRCSS